MATNELSFYQLSALLNAIMTQATGKTALAVNNTGDFVSVAQTALKAGYDPLVSAISQVLSSTIFSIRPYMRKLTAIEVDNKQFGNIVRKLKIADSDFQDDSRLSLENNASVDMYKVKKENVLQTNFYGFTPWEKQITVYKDQLDTAFTTPDEFQRFLTMQMTNANNLLEQARENLARATVANYIGGVYLNGGDGVIHLLTEYNTRLGLSGEDALTYNTVYLPQNYRPFMQWVASRISSISSMLTERTSIYQTNITNFGGTWDSETETASGGVDKTVSNFSPMEEQKLLLFAPLKYESEAMVLSDTYHENYLKLAANETVNFWQSVKTPDTVIVAPTYTTPTGGLVTAESTTISKVFGVLADSETMGYTLVNQWSAPTPFNPRGGYSNIFWHESGRYWNDFTEKGVVFLLD